MVVYSDDEIDYENEVPEFHTEQDLEDYLNDEEYDLMNEIFPLVKTGMEEYSGWTNLDLKLAIFDSDFNSDEALAMLMKDFKKKKTGNDSELEENPSKLSGHVNLTRQDLQPDGGNVTLLERLKRKRELTKSVDSSDPTLIDDKSVLNTEKKTLTLAEKLLALKSKNSTNAISVHNESAPSHTSLLASKLKALSTLNNNSSKSPNVEILNGSVSDVKVVSLADKLKALKQKKLNAETEKDKHNKLDSNEPTNSLSNEPTISSKNQNNVTNKNILQLTWNFIKEFNETITTLPNTSIENYTSQNSVFFSGKLNLKTRDNNNKECNIRKRYLIDIYKPFFPNKRSNTNNNFTVQQIASANFNKPSPDNVILTAQKNAFTEVQKSVGNLIISSKEDDNQKMMDKDNDEEDEFISKKEELVVKTYKKATIPTKPRNPINIEEYIGNVNPHCTFVVLGHVDAGKSTLMGRLLYDIGAVDSNLIRKLKKESERIGKGSFHLAWVMDQTTEERERGVTVSICTSDFKTEKTRFTIVDAPGHRDFVPSAIAGISQADVAIITIDCGTDAFESGFNLDGQTKEHSLLAKSMGVKHLIVAMNKLDTVDWFEGRFNQIKNELKIFFDDIGFKENQLTWVPLSGLSGEGVHNTPYPDAQNWYTGPSLIGALDAASEKVCKVSYDEIKNEQFLFSILEVSSSNKHEEGKISGRVESGSIQPGESITIYPSEQSVIVDKILVGTDTTPQKIAVKNDFVTLRIRNAYIEDIQAGDLGASIEFEIPPTQDFNINMLTFKLDRPILPGTSFMMFRGVCEQPARIAKLISSVDKKDPSKILKKKVRHLGSGQAAIVQVLLTEKKRWIPLLSYEDNNHLGRIVLRKDGRTIGAGIVMP